MDNITLDIVCELLKSDKWVLGATQSKICLPILKRIYKKMQLGINFENIKVANSQIVNGHHRYICSVLSEKPIGMDDWVISPSSIVYQWKNVLIIEQDYENNEQIMAHNKRDAELNGVDIRIFNDL